MCPFELFFNHYNHTELLQYSLVPNRLPQGFKAELSQGDFISCSKGKSVLSTIPEQIDIEEVEEDAGGLLPCPVEFQESGTPLAGWEVQNDTREAYTP